MIDGYRRRPLYSADNEDTRSELTALGINGDDTVVAIAAGGGRVLSLLTAGPKRLIAIDRRTDQLFNLELKAAAMEAFDLAGFQGFLGIAETPDRLDRYWAIRRSLSRSARRYWDNRRKLIEMGPFFAGRTESALVRFMRGLKAVGLMRWAEPFFQASSLEAQRVARGAPCARRSGTSLVAALLPPARHLSDCAGSKLLALDRWKCRRLPRPPLGRLRVRQPGSR